MLCKALGAIAPLEQKSLAGRDAGKLLFQLARLTGKNQGRKGRETAFDLPERGGIRIGRNLAYGLVSPGVRRPFRQFGTQYDSGGHDLPPFAPCRQDRKSTRLN